MPIDAYECSNGYIFSALHFRDNQFEIEKLTCQCEPNLVHRVMVIVRLIFSNQSPRHLNPNNKYAPILMSMNGLQLIISFDYISVILPKVFRLLCYHQPIKLLADHLFAKLFLCNCARISAWAKSELLRCISCYRCHKRKSF